MHTDFIIVGSIEERSYQQVQSVTMIDLFMHSDSIPVHLSDMLRLLVHL